MTENVATKEITADRRANSRVPIRPRTVRRYSPTRLLRQEVVIGEITVSAERYKGRLVVRVESAGGEPRGSNESVKFLQT